MLKCVASPSPEQILESSLEAARSLKRQWQHQIDITENFRSFDEQIDDVLVHSWVVNHLKSS